MSPATRPHTAKSPHLATPLLCCAALLILSPAADAEYNFNLPTAVVHNYSATPVTIAASAPASTPATASAPASTPAATSPASSAPASTATESPSSAVATSQPRADLSTPAISAYPVRPASTRAADELHAAPRYEKPSLLHSLLPLIFIIIAMIIGYLRFFRPTPQQPSAQSARARARHRATSATPVQRATPTATQPPTPQPPKSSLNPVVLPQNEIEPQWAKAIDLAALLAVTSSKALALGEPLLPTLVRPPVDHKQTFTRILNAEPEQVIEKLLANNSEYTAQAFVHDSLANMPGGPCQAMTIHVYCYGSAGAQWQIAIPYRAAAHRDGFALYPPVLVNASTDPQFNALLMHAFYRSIQNTNLVDGFWQRLLASLSD